MRAWRDSGLAVPPVAVNLSAHQFADNNLVTELRTRCRSTNSPPADLEVELTEAMLMTEPERARGVLHHLRQLGLHVTIDDFGTGYSSLAYHLKRFSRLRSKLDHSFVRACPTTPTTAPSPAPVVAMAHSLRPHRGGRGRQRPKQLEALRALKCDQIRATSPAGPVDAATLARNVLRPSEARPCQHALCQGAAAPEDAPLARVGVVHVQQQAKARHSRAPPKLSIRLQTRWPLSGTPASMASATTARWPAGRSRAGRPRGLLGSAHRARPHRSRR